MRLSRHASRARCVWLLLVAAAACRRDPPVSPAARSLQRAEGASVMVAAAHPLAAETGAQVLRDGGNAIDAAVATAFALGVVEPMMAGLGGGGGMTIWMQGSRAADYLDFYAAAGQDPAWGERWRVDSTVPERAVAVPGTVAGLLAAHRKYGVLPRARVIAPSIALARNGFTVHPLLATIILESAARIARDSAGAALLLPGGRPLAAGDRLVQPELAATLERIAVYGSDGFYRGDVAQAIARRLGGRSAMTLADLAAYAPRWRRPLCGAYRAYTVLTAPPPLNGAEVLETLALLEAANLEDLGQPVREPEALAVMVDAVRAARADRGRYLGMPDDVAVPAVGLTSRAFAAERRGVVGGQALAVLPPGDPWDEEGSAVEPRCAVLGPFAPTTLPRPAATDAVEATERPEHTTHLSVIDRDRNAVSLTFTVGLSFGSGVFAAGSFLNSAVLNFGGTGANRRAPGRTPRTAIAPTIVLDGDRVRLVVGSPGSGYIPPAIVHSIVYTLLFGVDPANALAMPRVYPSTSDASVIVEDAFPAAGVALLEQRGYRVAKRPLHGVNFGGVHMILVRPDGTLIGAADPRREGVAVGF